jgi:DNA-binding CsgD family transcriptional regulator
VSGQWDHLLVTGPLERDASIAELTTAARDAVNGQGSVCVVHGEAGIGKSSLIAACRPHWHDDLRVLTGYCDDLATPRTLGPIRDLIPFLGAELAQALRVQERDAVYAALRDEFSGADPAILIVEDVHWADEATFDVLRFLVRRIAHLPLVLVLTYRDDSVTDARGMRLLLGEIANGDRVHRIPLQRLSRAAVRMLSADSAIDADWLYRVSSGNPFFVTEVLRFGADTRTAPPTVIDAVIARTQQLSAQQRSDLERLAVIPSAVEGWLVQSLVSGGLHGLRAAEQAGLIVATPAQVSFRHELTRRALVDSLPGAKQIELNARVLAALTARPGSDPSRLVHHAVHAGDAEAISRYGVMAARGASRAGAHRESVAHYRCVLAHRDRLSASGLADVLEEYGIECYTTGNAEAACTALLEAVELRRRGTDRKALGSALHRLSRVQSWNGSSPSPELAAREAVQVLTGAGDDRLLAQACSTLAHHLHKLALRGREAVEYGERAVALARAVDDPAVLAYALNDLGSAQRSIGERTVGRMTQEESVRVATAANEVALACRARNNVAGALIEDLRLSEAEAQIKAAIELAEAGEHLGLLIFARTMGLLLAFYRSDWKAVDRATEAPLELQPPLAQWAFAAVAARVAIRRGRSEGDSQLAALPALAEVTDVDRIALVASGHAEAAWLRADLEAVRRHAEPMYDWARGLGHTRLEHEFGHWLIQAGCRIEPTTSLDPYALQNRGRPLEAATRWQAAGMPYEQAAALAESERPADLLAALVIVDRIGAGPLARIVRQRLRRQGVTHVPRGPVAKTRSRPDGLTARQVEVARLLARGWSNARIAESLFLSVRTIDNHVAAIFTKLGVSQRQEVRRRLPEVEATSE